MKKLIITVFFVLSICIFSAEGMSKTNVSEYQKEILNEKLLKAVEMKDWDEVEQSIADSADINAKDNNGNTALTLAAYYNNLDKVKQSIADGADVNAKNNSGNTALLWAAANKNLDMVKYLIEYGADINAQNNYGNTAFIRAVLSKNLDMVKYLIEHGADVNAQNNDGYSALIWAAYYNNLDIVKYLIEHGADVHAQNNDKKTAYDIAVDRNHVQVAFYLKQVSDYQQAIQDKKLIEFLNQFAKNNKVNELDDLFAFALSLGSKEDQAAFYDLSLKDHNYKKPLVKLEIAEKHDMYTPAVKILSKGTKISDLKLKELLKKAQKNNNKFFEKALVEYFKKKQVRMKKIVNLKRGDFPDVKFNFK